MNDDHSSLYHCCHRHMISFLGSCGNTGSKTMTSQNNYNKIHLHYGITFVPHPYLLWREYHLFHFQCLYSDSYGNDLDSCRMGLYSCKHRRNVLRTEYFQAARQHQVQRKQHTFSSEEILGDLRKVFYSKLGTSSGVLVTSVGVNDGVRVTALFLETVAYFF